jgi:hypothetical protein
MIYIAIAALLALLEGHLHLIYRIIACKEPGLDRLLTSRLLHRHVRMVVPGYSLLVSHRLLFVHTPVCCTKIWRVIIIHVGVLMIV